MNLRYVFIWLCLIGLAHAGGDPYADPSVDTNNETAADHLIDSEITKPAVPYRQADIPQDGALTAKEWAKQAEHRSVELRTLQHQLEVAKLNADIAASRKACRATGAENCSLTGSMMQTMTKEATYFVPKVIGINGSSAQIFDGVSLVWVLEGQQIANYFVDQVLLDSVILLSPNGRKIHQNIGVSNAVIPDK